MPFTFNAATRCALLACTLLLQSCSKEPNSAGPADPGQNATVHPEQWPKAASPLQRDAALEQRIAALLSKMTVAEKVGQIVQPDIASITPEQVRQYHIGSVLNGGNSAPGGDERAPAAAWLALADKFWLASTDNSDGGVAIPVLWGTDAVHGNSNVVGATIFPHNIGLGAMRDPALMKQIGAVTATEILVTGLDWTFAPTIAVARDDRWGRTFESFSENPEVVRAYAGPLIEGLQGKVGSAEFLDSQHILATAKHFVGDGGTMGGRDQGNTMASEADLRDIHAAGYPAAIGAGALTVMASFNSWQGHASHGHRGLLHDVLVERMGLDGFVVGDWNGHGKVAGCTPTNCAAAFNAGLDMFMAPDTWQPLRENLLKQVASGEISMARLDEAVARILRVKFRIGLFDAPQPSKRPLAGNYALLGSAEHRAIAREAARKSLVLLKNNEQILPLSGRLKVLVAGDGADSIAKQSGGWTLSWQGTGNRNEDFPNGESIYSGIKKAVETAGGSTRLSINGDYQQKPDVAIVVFGEEPYAEFQGDRVNLDFADDQGLQMLVRFKQAGIPTVAIFLSGRPLWVNPELNQADAFVAAFLPGTEGGALADVLFAGADGKPAFDFTGTLSFSWPGNAVGQPLNIGDADYAPLFAYGYGMSYHDKKNLAALSETSGLSTQSSSNDSLFIKAGKAVAPWQLQMVDTGISTLVENSTQVSANRALTVSATDWQQQEDAFTAEWNSPALLVIQHNAGQTIDISRQINGDMILEITLKVMETGTEPARLGLACGTNCGSYVDLSTALKNDLGKDWQTMKLLLRCFAEPHPEQGKFDPEHILSPFVLAAGKGMKLAIARIEIGNNAGDAFCPK